jgi:hypothetical protein
MALAESGRAAISVDQERDRAMGKAAAGAAIELQRTG